MGKAEWKFGIVDLWHRAISANKSCCSLLLLSYRCTCYLFQLFLIFLTPQLETPNLQADRSGGFNHQNLWRLLSHFIENRLCHAPISCSYSRELICPPIQRKKFWFCSKPDLKCISIPFVMFKNAGHFFSRVAVGRNVNCIQIVLHLMTFGLLVRIPNLAQLFIVCDIAIVLSHIFRTL